MKTRKNIEKKNFTKGGPYVNWPISVIFHEIPNPWKSLNRPSPVYSFKRSRNMSAMIVSVRFLWIWGFFRFFGLIFDHFLTKNSHFQNFFSKNGRKSIFFIQNQWKWRFLPTTTSLETIKINRNFKNLIFSRFSVLSRCGPILPLRVQCGGVCNHSKNV